MSHTPSHLLSPDHFKLLPPASFSGAAVVRNCSQSVREQKRQVKTRATPIAEAAILRELLQGKQELSDSVKARARARASGARGGGADLKGVQERAPRETPGGVRGVVRWKVLMTLM